ncbi:Transaldolase [Neobacillus rhizosphaerae]|uniref:Transaldolase n=1 Tax=Neobacillus rhizosphaerae TaxID=2880965 RepID=A0ABM9EN43_9BACI|nr:transaldolase family protein [Neobacillus rhizosphaerae]CAH2714043.1 Transaldolase [Neobacillus rhizosphaerae]
MQYFIDTANIQEIQEALALGVSGVTANPSMYLKEGVKFYDFLKEVNALSPKILTAEVIEPTLKEMLDSVDKILAINPTIVIKVNFSPLGLKLINILSKRGIKIATTLIFNTNQATIAIDAGTDYIFPFIGRNDEIGVNGIQTITDICSVIKNKNYHTKVVAASIKNVHHLEQAALAGADYAAVSYSIFEKAMSHQLTIDGAETFEHHWLQLLK